MEFTISIESNIDTDKASQQIMAAAKAALRDIVIDVTQEAKENSPVSAMYPSIDKSGRKPTDTNRKSINFEMGPGGDANLDELSGAVFSTSGYGGWLCVGTSHTPARPYLAPAAQKYFTKDKFKERLDERLA